ncbi:pyridoxamine 5'-phosphate oxidase family protein [Gordonia sp. CPCC 205333]|uniref:pyridoxamine 5'-phosphate oxidase family protein n=1 Tax=Gordonia sp. CPCC 205333 TaxID=3140790 RepID=UPI003AF38817
MPNNHYHHLVFGDRALARQQRNGSFVAYGAETRRDDDGPAPLDQRAVNLLVESFQFHLATVTEGGWPYVQYRSGPPGFIHHLGGSRIGFADHRGNAQYVSIGNIETNGRVAMFVADYPRRRRVKLFGHATVVEAHDDPQLLDALRQVGDSRISAHCERSIVIDVEALDWNCSRSMVPQYTQEQVSELTAGYISAIDDLRAEVTELRRQLTQPEPTSE